MTWLHYFQWQRFKKLYLLANRAEKKYETRHTHNWCDIEYWVNNQLLLPLFCAFSWGMFLMGRNIKDVVPPNHIYTTKSSYTRCSMSTNWIPIKIKYYFWAKHLRANIWWLWLLQDIFDSTCWRESEVENWLPTSKINRCKYMEDEIFPCSRIEKKTKNEIFNLYSEGAS